MLSYIITWINIRMRNEDGQDLIEYALLGGLIAGALLAAGVLLALTGALDGMAEGIGDCIDFESSTTCEVG